MFAKGKFLIELANSNFKYYRYKWVWHKNLATGFLNAKKMPLCAHEDILIFYRKLPTYNPQHWFSVPKVWKTDNFVATKNYNKVNFPHGGYNSPDGKRLPIDTIFFKTMLSGGAKYANKVHTIHPNEKPVELLEYLIKTYSNEGETVLDATAGSGSTAVAAINTGRNFIGFELDEHYFEVAKARIEEAQNKKDSASLELFDKI